MLKGFGELQENFAVTKIKTDDSLTYLPYKYTMFGVKLKTNPAFIFLPDGMRRVLSASLPFRKKI